MMLNRYRKCEDAIGEERYCKNIARDKKHIEIIKKDIADLKIIFRSFPEWSGLCIPRIIETKLELLAGFKDGVKTLKRQRREWRASYKD